MPCLLLRRVFDRFGNILLIYGHAGAICKVYVQKSKQSARAGDFSG